MKKVLTNPVVIGFLLCAMFICGVLWGRHSTTSVLRLKINKATEKPYTEEKEQLQPSDYVIADKININDAPVEVFAILPGLNQSLAQKIVAYRDEHGPFKSVDELRNVNGIGEKKLNAIRKYIEAK